MDWPTLFSQLVQLLIDYLPKVIAAVVILVATGFLSSFVSKQLYRTLKGRSFKEELTRSLSRIVKWSIWIGGIIWSLSVVGFNVTAFFAGMGIAGLIIGFALQDISKNFTAGALLMLQEPFNFGDYIEVAGYEGTVTDIQLRATELLSPDGVKVLIPNGDVFTSTIRNFTRTNRRRVELTIGVAYDSDLKKVTRVAIEAIHAVPGLLDEPEPILFFHEFGDSAIVFSIRYWFSTSESDIFTAKDVGVRAIKSAFDREGIAIPYPIHTVLIANQPTAPPELEF